MSVDTWFLGTGVLSMIIRSKVLLNVMECTSDETSQAIWVYYEENSNGTFMVVRHHQFSYVSFQPFSVTFQVIYGGRPNLACW